MSSKVTEQKSKFGVSPHFPSMTTSIVFLSPKIRSLGMIATSSNVGTNSSQAAINVWACVLHREINNFAMFLAMNALDRTFASSPCKTDDFKL